MLKSAKDRDNRIESIQFRLDSIYSAKQKMYSMFYCRQK